MNVFGYIKTQFLCSYRERKEVLSHMSGVHVQICLLKHAKLILKCDLEKVHATEKTAQLRSWKKTPTAIGMYVSKLHVTFCGAAAKLKARMTVS